VHKPLPQAHIHPDNPGADHTTGRTGTTARTSAIVHSPPCSGLCLGTFGRGLRRVAVGHGGLGPGGGTAEKLGREEAGAEVTEGLGRGKAGPRRGRARAGPRRGAGQAGLELGPSWAAERLSRGKAEPRKGWGRRAAEVGAGLCRANCWRATEHPSPRLRSQPPSRAKPGTGGSGGSSPRASTAGP